MPQNNSILVLEDEPSVLALIAASLNAGGFDDVLTASTIQEARILWKTHDGRFELLLSDFSLPDGSAAKLIEDLLRQKPGLQVVLMSGLPEDALGLEPSLASKMRIMGKPFRPSELLAFLNEIFEPVVSA